MIRYYEGTVFNAGTEALVNTVNCDGVMGAGIALEFGLRYPNMYEDYIERCKKGDVYVGGITYYRDDSGILIVNFPTKNHFKFPSRLEWIESGLKAFVDSYQAYNFKSIAFPKLGTSKGGLDWSIVKHIMEKYLSDINIEVVICLDEINEAVGVERQMLDLFNRVPIETLSTITRLNSKQKDIIIKKRPFRRFWEIGRAEGVGKKTYASLFTYYYKRVIDNDMSEQLTLECL